MGESLLGRGSLGAVGRVLHRGGSSLLVIVSVPLGAVCAWVALLAIVAISRNIVLALTTAAVAVVCVTGGLSWVAARGIPRRRGLRRWLPVAVSGLTLSGVAVLVWALVLAPAPPYTVVAADEETQYWTLPTGSRIAYKHMRAEGERQPTPVILVHGGPGAPGALRSHLMTVLARSGFDAYDYHQVGAGLSGRLDDVRDYTVARHVADLEAIRRIIRAERIVLIGGSWGAQLIANYLAAHPEHVARAVVYSPGPIWAPAFTEDERLTSSGRQDQENVAKAYPRFILAHVLIQIAGPQTVHALLPDRQMDGVFQAFVGDLDMRSGCDMEQPADGSRSGPAGIGFWVNIMTGRDTHEVADPRPKLRSVTAPVLVLRAECDYLAWEVTREYRDLLAGARLLVVENAGHTIPKDEPELYKDVVRAFLLEEPLPLEPYTSRRTPSQGRR